MRTHTQSSVVVYSATHPKVGRMSRGPGTYRSIRNHLHTGTHTRGWHFISHNCRMWVRVMRRGAARPGRELGSRSAPDDADAEDVVVPAVGSVFALHVVQLQCRKRLCTTASQLQHKNKLYKREEQPRLSLITQSMAESGNFLL